MYSGAASLKKGFRMLNEPNYYALYLAKLKSEELRDFFEIEQRTNTEKQFKKQENNNQVKSHILESTGRFLISTGNRIMDIA
jgi:pyruvate formate-lyase activating enzyme-like uncharacterized protein